MKRLTCEMCGSTALIKQDGIFECQSCGCKYSVEEAKKLMVEGVVEVEGTVAVDRTNEVNTLLKRAEIALQDNEIEKAKQLYVSALEIAPENGEIYWRKFLIEGGYLFEQGKYCDILYCRSNFFSEALRREKTIFDNKDYRKAVAFADEGLKKNIQKCVDTFLSNAMYCSDGSIKPMGYVLALKKILPLFDEIVVFYDKKKLEELSDKIDKYLEEKTANLKDIPDQTLFESSAVHIKLTKYGVEYRVCSDFKLACYEDIVSIKENYYTPSDDPIRTALLTVRGITVDEKAYFKNNIFQTTPSVSLEVGLTQNITCIKEIVDRISLYRGTEFTDYEVIKPKIAPKGGCYVATCVYGSYDCPQVWTLRRYRDAVLKSTWYGRAFVRMYYAISPTLVKWFGKTNWFKKMWRGKLDKMVASLNSNGVEDTPYKDKE